MTLDELSNIYNDRGWPAAANAIEDATLTRKERDELYDKLERLEYEKLRRYTHPSRILAAAFNPHEF